MKLVKVDFRRRREGKTDYGARAEMLKSGFPRLVIRKTNKYIIAQIVQSNEAQDKVVVSANSKELAKHKLKSLKNLGAAYMTGMLIAEKAKKAGINKVIVDSGLIESTKGSKVYAVVKGAIENGLDVKCDEKMFPKEERIKAMREE